MSITVERAIKLALAHTPELPEEEAPLCEAVGRILARRITAPMDQPPFDRSPLDGYAVCASDTMSASAEMPVRLQVVDKICAGQVSQVAIQPGQAVRLMTGAMLPKGADAVIRQEDTDLGEERVKLFRGVRPGQNCCWRGEEYRAGTELFPAGTRIDAAAAAVAAGAGLTHLPVYRRARAAVISTGDEIRQPGQPLLPGKIYDSNTIYLKTRLKQLGVEVTAALSEGDDVDGIVTVLERFSGCDLILTTGGVSVGQKDLLETAVKAFGAEVIFHGIAVKPGMPTLLAKRGDLLILGLSGNPFSAAVPFELLLRPMLAKMTRDPELEMRRRKVTAANDFAKASPTRRFLRAFVRGNMVSMPAAQSNGQMRSMVGCNCLIDLPAGSGAVRQGDCVDVLLL